MSDLDDVCCALHGFLAGVIPDVVDTIPVTFVRTRLAMIFGNRLRGHRPNPPRSATKAFAVDLICDPPPIWWRDVIWIPRLGDSMIGDRWPQFTEWTIARRLSVTARACAPPSPQARQFVSPSTEAIRWVAAVRRSFQPLRQYCGRPCGPLGNRRRGQ